MFIKKYKITLSLFIILTFTFTAFGLEDNWSRWNRGKEAIKDGNFNRARREFNYYIRHPEMHRHMFGIAYFGRGLVFDAIGKDELAIKEYRMAIKNDLHPTVQITDKAYINIGNIYMRNNNVTILGTDISDEAITKASYGYYNWVDIERGLPPDKLNRYFHKENDKWKIDDEIRSLATFKKLNLMNDFSHLGQFDIVFCRNVAIYFPEEKKKSLFNRISKLLKPDGALIIGSTESIATVCPTFESKRYLRSIFYQLKQ